MPWKGHQVSLPNNQWQSASHHEFLFAIVHPSKAIDQDCHDGQCIVLLFVRLAVSPASLRATPGRSLKICLCHARPGIDTVNSEVSFDQAW